MFSIILYRLFFCTTILCIIILLLLVNNFCIDIFRTTVYIEHSLAWYDLKTQMEVLNYKIFSRTLEAIGTPGLTGLDKLISFYVVIELSNMVHYIEKNIRNKVWSSTIDYFDVILNSVDGPKGIIM